MGPDLPGRLDSLPLWANGLDTRSLRLFEGWDIGPNRDASWMPPTALSSRFIRETHSTRVTAEHSQDSHRYKMASVSSSPAIITLSKTCEIELVCSVAAPP